MPDITSYLTAAGAYQTRDLVLKLAPTSAVFFHFFFFSSRVTKKSCRCTDDTRLFLFASESLSVSVGSIRYTVRVMAAAGGGGAMTVRVGLFFLSFFAASLSHLDTTRDAPERSWCLHAANGVTTASETIQRNNLSKGKYYFLMNIK